VEGIQLNSLVQFGASVFPANADTDFIADVTGVLTDNLPIVLVIFGTVVGIRWAFKLFTGATKGKVRI